jgi:hypothetical protein
MGADNSLQISLRRNRPGRKNDPDSGPKQDVCDRIADWQIHGLQWRIAHNVVGDGESARLQQGAKGLGREMVKMMARVEAVEGEWNAQRATGATHTIENPRFVGY